MHKSDMLLCSLGEKKTILLPSVSFSTFHLRKKLVNLHKVILLGNRILSRCVIDMIVDVG